MKLTFHHLVRLSAAFGIISFVFLILAIGSDFWYIIDTSRKEMNSSASLSSHSGLWRTCYFNGQCQPFINPFGNRGNFTDSQRHILNLQASFIVLLPLSVIILFISGMMGVISILAGAHKLVFITGLLLICGAFITLASICLYITYSSVVFSVAVWLCGRKTLEDIDIFFGWSLVLATVSSIIELVTAIACLLTSAHLKQLMRQNENI